MPGGDGWLKKFSSFVVREENDGEWRMYCPLHEDPLTSKSASGSMNPAKGVFHCFGRCGGYKLSDVYKMWQEGVEPEAELPRNVISMDKAPSRRSSAGTTPLPTEAKIEEWRERLAAKKTLVQEIEERRGLTAQTLRRFKLGWDGERITIPVRDAEGKLLNVRRYKMNAGRANNKMINWAGHGDAVLFLPDSLTKAKRQIILCEGEMDALLLRQYGFPVVTGTAGAGTWLSEWTSAFVGRSVYIVFDVDDTGEKGARKVSAALKGVAESVRIVRLPLQQKGADVTDYFVSQGYSKADFVSLLKQTPKVRDARVSRQRDQHEPVSVRMAESFNPEYVDRPVTMVATISGRSAAPSALAQAVELNCPMDWQKPKCGRCPMELLYGGHHSHKIPADAHVLLKMMDTPEEKRREVLLADLEIPHTCPRVQVDTLKHWRVDELAVVPNVDDPDDHDTEQVLRRVFNVTESEALTPVNTTARLTGVSTPDPKTGKVVFQSWDVAETKTSLEAFTMTPELMAELSHFQPNEEQSPMDKLNEIAHDMAANVTKIYGRPELHIAYDLVWHSALSFDFRGKREVKGWLEMLVMGDTRTGKSEAAEHLRQHYRAGILKSCEGATLAGLVGGAQQIGNSWVITWGTIPLQDRRLVILDEASGLADKGILEQMSAVRSSGRAQVSKIVSQETFARTRAIWISNPPDGRRINETNNGAIDAIGKLIPNPEDIARFDFAMVASGEDVESSLINSAEPPTAPHRHTSARSAALVTWAWSRRPEDIVWAEGVEDFVLRKAGELGARYIADPPLVQPENVRIKLARLAVAVAARLFHHDGTGQRILVEKEHVHTAVQFLDLIYGKRWFGYSDHSRKEIEAKQRATANRSACYDWLREHDRVLTTLISVINDTQFRGRDLEDFGGVDKESAAAYIGQLLRMGMIRRRSRGYINMTPDLIGVVRELQDKGFGQ
jgi:5S rRNA maturation endonuclease (ribonuclease M5)